jgi:ATP-dependent Clp protease, protease subunit
VIETTRIDPRIREADPSNLLFLPKTIHVQEFTEESAKTFRRDMALAHRTRQPVIPVIIDSYGGDVYALLSMIDVIATAKVRVATIVLGKAMSSAAILFSCGAEGFRFMGPLATIMIHDIANPEPADNRKTEEIRADAGQFQRLNQKIYRILDRNCGQEPGFFWKKVHERGRADWFMGPREAKRLRLANHLRVPTLETSVKVHTRLVF